jgi:hypothetical protein
MTLFLMIHEERFHLLVDVSNWKKEDLQTHWAWSL